MSSERYLDDFSVGERFVTPAATLTESAIIDFALSYDPQPFHLETREPANKSPSASASALSVRNQGAFRR